MASIKQKNIGEIVLTTGSTVNVDSGDVSAPPYSVADSATIYRVTGTETLSVSAFTISITGASGPTKNTQVDILWEAVATPTVANKVVIAGATIPDELVGGNFLAKCTYNGSSWVVVTSLDMNGTGLIAAKLLATDSITTAKIVALAVTTAKINDLAVTTGKLAAGAVTAAKITAATITTAEIAANTITAANIAAGTLTATELANLTVTAAKIANNTITATQIAAATITATELSANANRYTRDIEVSFSAAAEVGVLNFIICNDCTIETVSGSVKSPFADDDGTVIFKNHAGTVMTDSQIDFGTGLVLGNQITNTVTGNNTFTAGQKITIETSKTTKTSGKATISLCILKT